ncbi:MAG TPA: L-threonylcarbamoyladenylate synthase [Candidatus Methylomirabilis sp.]|nr:L-threonylcarbamoyladenylate synthase [Candidatus Methylomirabilis sp.]HSC72027.1 L-threonylcarbamoyladenylate synthase [Candidatus Methylomirabilis sp.]
MKSRVLTVDPTAPQADVIRQAREVLSCGCLVAFPTDTLYALGGSALQRDAIERVHIVKGRHHGKPLSVLVPSVEASEALAAGLSDGVRDLMRAFWPGALTIIVKASPSLPTLLTAATGTVGLRMPGGAVAQALLSAFGGPIIGTSANKAGGPDPADAKTVQRAIGGQIDLILDGGRVQLGVPSTVIDCTVTPARILREGSIPRTKLREKIALEA